MHTSTNGSTSPPTRWTLIVRAQGSGRDARNALGELIRRYEKFILWLIRYYRHPPDTTEEDLKQEYLRRVLERNDIAELDRARGSFRGWLRCSVRNFLSNEWDAWKVKKAGRDKTVPATFDASGTLDPEEALCTRRFAEQMLSQALSTLRAEQRDKEQFDRLIRFLPGPQLDLVAHEPYARSIGMSRVGLAQQVARMRARFAVILRAAVRETLADDTEPDDTSGGTPAAVEEEMRALRRVLDDDDVVRVFLEEP
jgi:hypothetical protein